MTSTFYAYLPSFYDDSFERPIYKFNTTKELFAFPWFIEINTNEVDGYKFLGYRISEHKENNAYTLFTVFGDYKTWHVVGYIVTEDMSIINNFIKFDETKANKELAIEAEKDRKEFEEYKKTPEYKKQLKEEKAQRKYFFETITNNISNTNPCPNLTKLITELSKGKLND
jgi:hypothetical protein